MSHKTSEKTSDKTKGVAPMRKLADTELHAVCGGAGEMPPGPDAPKKHHGGKGHHKSGAPGQLK